MQLRRPLLIALLLGLLPAATAVAQPGPPPAARPMDAAARDVVITGLSAQLEKNYVFPQVATSVAAALRKKAAAGGYAAATDTTAFADALSKDLRAFGKDGHFAVEFAPGMEGPPPGQANLPSADDLARGRVEAAKRGYGIERVERLPGNVGYIEIRGFGPTELVGDAFTAAISLLDGSDAVIVDLRRNGGGEPSSVAHLLSHFFPQGDVRHLNDIYSRPTDTTQQYWTNPAVAVRYTGPVYVLTSARTFSGGEEAAYDFQTQKRATLVGETTGGGANPGDMVPIGGDFAAFIPTGKAINPITGTNWEHVGVKPDVAVPAADALKTAHAAILRTLVEAAKDPEEKAELQSRLDDAVAGKVRVPV